jgi:hypothetical protein
MNPTEIFLVASLVSAVALWVFAEFRWARGPRVFTTLLLIALSCYFTHLISRILPRYESDLHASCIAKVNELLASGKVDEARSAVSLYAQKRNGDNGYAAASEMWIHLNAKIEK